MDVALAAGLLIGLAILVLFVGLARTIESPPVDRLAVRTFVLPYDPVVVREAILRIFALTPDYEDCWTLSQGRYHGPDIWRRADRALARHPDDPVALERRAQIAIALELPGQADSLAALAGQPRTELFRRIARATLAGTEMADLGNPFAASDASRAARAPRTAQARAGRFADPHQRPAADRYPGRVLRQDVGRDEPGNRALQHRHDAVARAVARVPHPAVEEPRAALVHRGAGRVFLGGGRHPR